MRIAVLSNFESPCEMGLEDSYVRAFRSLGHDVAPVSTATPPNGLPRGLKQLAQIRAISQNQSALHDRAMAHAPDLVFIVKGRGVLAGTVRRFRRAGLTVVNVFPDNPFDALGQGLIGRAFMAQFRELTRIFVHDRFAVGQLRRIGARAEFIAFARDPLLSAEIPQPRATIADSVVFVGNPDDERIRYLRAIADTGLALYGHWQGRLQPGDPLLACVRGGPQFGTEMMRAIGSARLSVNVLRQSQKTAHNMRTFEAPACGVCCLSEASVGVEELLDARRETRVFRTPEELRRLVRDLLASPATVEELARAGHAAVASETYARRATEILAALEVR